MPDLNFDSTQVPVDVYVFVALPTDDVMDTAIIDEIPLEEVKDNDVLVVEYPIYSGDQN